MATSLGRGLVPAGKGPVGKGATGAGCRLA